MNKKELFYKAIIWQIIGLSWISMLSYIWFGSWLRSLSFSMLVVIISIFAYILYELAWNKIIKNKGKNQLSFQPPTVLTSKNSSMPIAPASRPIPECLYPPNGASTAIPAPLTSTIPDLNFLATLFAFF